jgi:hypothetical protein
MRSLAWLWFLRLTKKGKDINEFVGVFLRFLGRAVSSGRRISGVAKSKDVLNTMAQRRYGFKVESLETSNSTSHEQLYASPHGQDLQDTYEDRLRDNTQTPVPEQVAFRIDFAAWLRTLTGRERRIIRAMSLGERTKDISKEFEVSPARISQMRQEFHDDWQRFCATPDERVHGRTVAT